MCSLQPAASPDTLWFQLDSSDHTVTLAVHAHDATRSRARVCLGVASLSLDTLYSVHGNLSPAPLTRRHASDMAPLGSLLIQASCSDELAHGARLCYQQLLVGPELPLVTPQQGLGSDASFVAAVVEARNLVATDGASWGEPYCKV